MTSVDKVRTLCKDRGISIRKLESELGFSNGYINSCKSGKITLDRLVKIADYFSVFVGDLFDDEMGEVLEGSRIEKKRPDLERPTRIPVLGRVAAGIPITAVQEIVDWEEIPADMALRGEFFGLELKGDSMSPYMPNGSHVIVRNQDTAEDGDIAIVSINGEEATCKKVRIKNDGIILLPLNPTYEPMYYTKQDIEQLPVKIWGKVVECRTRW